LIYKNFCSRVVSRVIAAGLIIAMSRAALAQESPRPRVLRRVVSGAIERRDDGAVSGPPAAVDPNQAQGPGRARSAPAWCNLFPAPASVGTKVDLTYFGPPSSTVNQSLVGSVQLLKTGPVDAKNGTITIPLSSWAT